MTDDGSIGRYDVLARRVLSARPHLGIVRYVAVDGPAGSGKTTFARRLGAALTAAGHEVAAVHTDDLLDGWRDMLGFWPRFVEQILQPLSRGEPGLFQPYDWHRDRFADQWVEVPPREVLLVEGVSSARMASCPLRSLAVVVHAPRQLRLERGIARDGEELRGHWTRWMAAEDTHFAVDRTWQHADLVVNGAPGLPHDPEHEFVRLR